MSSQKRARGPVLCVLIALIAASLACGGGATDTPTPRPTPTKTLAKEPEVLVGLKEEIFFDPGGGGGQSGCLGCPGGGALPEISWFNLDCICLRGFPLDEEITVELHAPLGHVYSGTYQVWVGDGGAALARRQPPLVSSSAEAGYVGKAYDGVDAIWIKLWGAAGLPTGKWLAVARSESAVAKAELDLETVGWEQISVTPAWSDPFQGERGLAHTFFCCSTDYYNVYSPGEQVVIRGADLPPGQDLALGIYHSQPDSALDPATLVHSQMVSVAKYGRFSTIFEVDPSYAPGCYTVMVVTDPDLDYGESPYHGGLRFTGPTGCFRVP